MRVREQFCEASSCDGPVDLIPQVVELRFLGSPFNLVQKLVWVSMFAVTHRVQRREHTDHVSDVMLLDIGQLVRDLVRKPSDREARPGFLQCSDQRGMLIGVEVEDASEGALLSLRNSQN